MPSSLSDLTSASAIFLVGYPAWMAYTGLYPTYLLQNVVVLLAILSSGYYHACWTTDPPYCPYHATREVQDFADLLFAFMGLVASTPLIYEWWLKLRFTVHGNAIHAAYCTVGCLLTFVLVTHFQQGVGTTLTLALYYGLPLCYALYSELVRDGERHSTWWFVRLVAGLACIVAGVVVFEIETNREFNPNTLDQSDTYLGEHVAWHCLVGAGTSILITLVDGGGKLDKRDYKAVAKQQSKPLI